MPVTPPRPLPPAAPVAARRPHVRRHHGDQIVDDYAWLADRDDPAVTAHLEAENAYAEQVTRHLAGLRETLVGEIRSRTLETDLSVPVAHRGWWYYSRTRQGHQYPIHCRVPVQPDLPRPQPDPGADLPGEQVLIDGNIEAAGHDFFALGGSEVTLAGDRVGYLVDTVGDERFRLVVKDIATGEILDEAITGAGYGLAWSMDGRQLFYTRVDQAWRPFQVWRHELGTGVEHDVLVHQEDDERFWMGLGSSRDESLLVIHIASKTTSEVLLLDLAEPTSRPRVVTPRRDGVEYEVEPCGDGLLIVHNAAHRDFGLAWAPLTATAADDWVPVLRALPGERLLGVDAFAGQVVVSLRSQGLTALRVLPRRHPAAHPVPGTPPQQAHRPPEFGPSWDVPVAETLYTIALGDNPAWATETLQVVTESFVTPRTVSELDLRTRLSTVLKRQPVLGGYDPGQYRQHRVWVRAEDGVQVPMSVVHRSDVQPGPDTPGLLYGYGAYEVSLDPWFSVPRLSVLDRGVLFAVAHVRGGGELGRGWYEDGRLSAKVTSFTDLVSCARELVDAERVAPDRLALQGGSAGGLLVGAALNLAPELFRVVLAQVPFVDTLTTILDPSLPLTVPEWEEWGNPLDDPAVYAYLKSYSPCQNVRPVDYPAILATTSLNDTRVAFTEPAKWVARLRALVTSDQAARPILLRTEMSAGHGGRSGRYHAWEQYAWEMSFVLDQLGATDGVSPPPARAAGRDTRGDT